MRDFKSKFIHPDLESPNILIFQNSILEAVAEVDTGTEEDTEVEDMVLDVVVYMVDEKDVVEVAMVITHIHLPAGT